jgi:hypothetical protein
MATLAGIPYKKPRWSAGLSNQRIHATRGSLTGKRGAIVDNARRQLAGVRSISSFPDNYTERATPSAR